MPTCAQARPSTCPCCQAAGQPLGEKLVIVGHGLVERQVLGPMTATTAPEVHIVQLRRYRCRACKAVLLVGPRGIVRRRWYSASAIGLAIASYAQGETSAAVRRRIRPSVRVGGSACERWVTLVRWLDAAGRGELFGVRDVGAVARRRVAKVVTLALAGRAGRDFGEELALAAFDGAVAAA